MILKGFKEKSNKKYINSILKSREVELNDEKIKSVILLLYIETDGDIIPLIQVLEAIKKQFNKVSILAFAEDAKEHGDMMFNLFEANDIGWRGKIKNTELALLLNQKYDASISYYKTDSVNMNMLSAKVNSSFKIGVDKTDERFHDLIIDTRLSESSIFKKELLKYLEILNKI